MRDGKGAKDRVTMLPGSLKADLLEHLKAVKRLHEKDLRDGNGRVHLPHALARKYPDRAQLIADRGARPVRREQSVPNLLRLRTACVCEGGRRILGPKA